ncbi:MAG: NAD(P)H-dependent glycerol-3-phosphate dehydrogenase [Clostridia bacterium]|jgi:glycerol-3-phosphate dehydrogenase (NAD(P)+)|nr:NAD(P)H-dependent glycerol-3-phosphate dehydrogenase [Clostridia bacterium]MCI1999453.1 NAD(P)H-dependent glycerol-3-phosphate dehydrogenase [Clostridia bacterium]MCI2014168.1 NAD(P)H-dependent glycerol-3-phosphate dehydrogenase [Clostridia bacterium]
MKKVTVVGSGSWGTALAVMLDKYGHEVKLWSRRKEEAEKIRAEHENKEYLPGIKINESIITENDRLKAVGGADIVIMAIPSKFVRENMELFSPFLKPEQVIVNVAKGLERGSLLRLSQVIRECIPQCKVCTMVGPSHAEEVGKGIPTACVVSCDDMNVAKMIQSEFMNPTFRIYTNSDEIGIEIGAALKNVIALAAGANDGLGFGDNTKAALMTRGLAEIARLGVKMGGNPLTFNGLSGMGDLIVTCTSMHSRNRRAGILLGKGTSLKNTLKEVHMVVEGVNTAKAAYDLAKEYNVEMPITETVNKVLFEGQDVREGVVELMNRDGKEEIY